MALLPKEENRGYAQVKRYSLSRSERITKTSEFKAGLKDGAVYSGRSLKLKVAPNKYGKPRIGISLGRHHFKLAVQRNKLRRYLKEAFRLNKYNFNKGYDIIVIPRANCAGLKFRELNDEFIGTIKKSGIFKKA
jgi:ribonuclease P protein component